MKSLTVAFCLLLTVSATYADILDIYFQRLNDTFLKCGKEHGISEMNARAIFEKDTKADQVSCFRACLLKSSGMMENSKLIKEKVMNEIQTLHSDNPDLMEKMKQIATECIEKAANVSDECKMAHSYITCYLDKVMKGLQ